MSADCAVVPVQPRHWPALADLEHEVYAASGLSEGGELLRARVGSSPSTSFALERHGRLAGYALAFAHRHGHCPELRRHRAPDDGGTRNLHLHDLVVAPAHRRAGLGPRLLAHLTAAARADGFERLSLVAVAGGRRFWSVQGFTVEPEVTPPAAYGPGAVYMSAPVTATAVDPSPQCEVR
ncbi:GNAT family N-acetyltransferase [Streptomyces sp. XM4193]|uniref:GNAT family N-acetyltransferase n=1 Tax=Streptomyces sp. XM4193 TaxID=2929782 RepID=UPI001FFA8C22|nr:GNAT family N-acetyltransferase [Streptomyces sp. XM4193]MCK1797599.1 GNAT family N-acetyltransferase [Streptomyces sp. XM4193]